MGLPRLWLRVVILPLALASAIPSARAQTMTVTNGLTATSLVVPLGVDPPPDVSAAIAKAPACGSAPTMFCKDNISLAAFRIEVTLPGGIVKKLLAAGHPLNLAIEAESVPGADTPQALAPLPRAHLRTVRRDGTAEPRSVAIPLQSLIPAAVFDSVKYQSGANVLVSPWIIAIADPRAAAAYDWGAATTAEKRAAGCFSCDRPLALQGKGEADGVYELYTAGRFISVRLDSPTGSNPFAGTAWAYLGEHGRLTTRVITTMADTVRPPSVLVAGQNPPAAGGAIQETVYLHSGELETSHIDLDAGGRAGWDVMIDRTYRSRAIGGTALGAGWTSSIFRHLRPLPSGDVEYRDAAGEIWLFKGGSDASTYVSPKGLFLKLTATANGWTLFDQKWRLTTFDGFGRITAEGDEFTSQLDRNAGNTVRYLYDISGRLTEILDPVNRATTLTYDSATGLLINVTDWRGRKIDYAYDGSQRLATVGLSDIANTSGSRPTIRYAYVAAGSSFNDTLELAPDLASITDPIGGPPRVSFAYGIGAERDEVISQQWATGESASFVFSPGGATTTDILGQKRDYVLTAQAADYQTDRAHASSVTEDAIAVSGVPFGELPKNIAAAAPSTIAVDRTTTLTYDINGLVQQSVLFGIRTTTFTWNDLSSSGAPGFVLGSVTTTPIAGTSSKRLSAKALEPITETFDYQADANGVAFLDHQSASQGSGPALTVSSPEAHRNNLAPVTNNDGITSTTTLDVNGLPIESTSEGGTDPAGAGSDTKVTYAAATDGLLQRRGLPLTVDMSGVLQTTDYPDVDTTVETDERGVVTTTSCNSWREPVHVTVAGSDQTLDESYTYDANGRLATETRKQGAITVTTTHTYDAMGRELSRSTDNVAVLGTTATLATSTAYNYPAHLVTTTTPSGAVMTTTIDALGRTSSVHTETGVDPIDEAFAYDLDDHQVFSTDGASAVASAFDAHGREISTRRIDGTESDLTYDAWGHVTGAEERDSVGSVIASSSMTLTPAGRLQSISTDVDDSQIRISAFAWDGGGRTTGTAVSERAQHTSYDAAGRMVSSQTGAGSAASVSTPFTSSTVGGYEGFQPVSITSTEKTGGNYHVSQQLDTFGTAKETTVAGLTWREQHDEAGNVVAASLPNRPASTYAVDGRGAVMTETLPDTAQIGHQYDATGSDSKYTDQTDEPTSTTNDKLGRPLMRIYADGTTEQFIYRGPRLVSRTDRQGKVQKYDFNDRNQVIAIENVVGITDRFGYDIAGRLVSWTTDDSEITFENFDLDGHPRKTMQTRFKNGSGLAGGIVLDSYSQEHSWNEHGERTGWTAPVSTGPSPASGWTKSLTQTYDAMGNLVSIQRTTYGGAISSFFNADYRNAGRPDHRTVTTDCGGNPLCTTATVQRSYSYDEKSGQLRSMSVATHGLTVGGSAVTYNGLQIATEQLLGVSAGSRFNRYGYDARSRLVASVAAKEMTSPEDLETLTSADFRKEIDRTSATPVDPPSLKFTESDKGHKIAQLDRGGDVRTFTYNGSERRDDDRYIYDFDDRGRLIRVTEKLNSMSLALRRISYVYSGNDRLIGRIAEYASLSPVGTPPLDSDWKLEDRNDVLASDGLAASTTFVWDPISDTLVAIFGTDGALIRQILHGGLGYDDPLEVTVAGTDGGISRLYPLYDESGNGTLTAILNTNGEIVSRNLASGGYGEEEVAIAGSAVDHVAVKATTDATGAPASIDVSIRTTEAIKAATLASGIQLAAVTSTGTVVRTATALPTLSDDAWTANVHLTGADWAALTSTDGGAVSLSVAVTSTLRADGFADVPVLPAPDWAKATEPIYSSPALPVEVRQSLTTLATTLAAIAPSSTTTTTLYDVPSLAALGTPEIFGTGSTAADAARLLVTATFQAHPFQEPFTGQDYVRARWFDPATGVWISPDPAGYSDSSNLYAYAGGDPVNGRDPLGLQSRSDLSDDPRRVDVRQHAEAASQAARVVSHNAADALSRRCASDNLRPECQQVLASLLDTLYGDKSSVRLPRQGAAHHPGRRPIAYINGVNTSSQEAIATANQLSALYGAPVDPLYNPTRGLFVDLTQMMIINKMFSVPDSSTMLVASYARQQLKALPAGETLTLVAHSQGGAVTSAALSFLTSRERARINLIVFGGVAWTYPSDLHSDVQFANPLDLGPMLLGKGPEGVYRSIVGGNSHANAINFLDFNLLFPRTHFIGNYLAAMAYQSSEQKIMDDVAANNRDMALTRERMNRR